MPAMPKNRWILREADIKCSSPEAWTDNWSQSVLVHLLLFRSHIAAYLQNINNNDDDDDDCGEVDDDDDEADNKKNNNPQ